MEYNYPENTKDCNVTYHRTHTGPNFFRVYYKQGCCIRFTPKEVGRVFGIAKFTPTVNKIRDWAKEMVQQYESSSSLSDEADSTVGDDKVAIEEPNDNTKMVI